jgi:hypothetical protein
MFNQSAGITVHDERMQFRFGVRTVSLLEGRQAPQQPIQQFRSVREPVRLRMKASRYARQQF